MTQTPPILIGESRCICTASHQLGYLIFCSKIKCTDAHLLCPMCYGVKCLIRFMVERQSFQILSGIHYSKILTRLALAS